MTVETCAFCDQPSIGWFVDGLGYGPLCRNHAPSQEGVASVRCPKHCPKD